MCASFYLDLELDSYSAFFFFLSSFLNQVYQGLLWPMTGKLEAQLGW